jgi:crossover junction endodeoxyribonuclease RusA
VTPSNSPAAGVGEDPAAGVPTWQLRLPLVRPLTLNSRQHWAAKARDVKALRDATCLLARQARIPRCDHIAVGLVYYPPNLRRRDPHNITLTLKPAVDGLVDAGVVEDDDAAYVTVYTPVIAEPDPDPRLILTIYPVAA